MRLGRDLDVAAALWWFDQTHELVSTGFAAYWRLAWLPGPGNVGEQDAWLWEAMQIVKAERTRALQATTKPDELQGWRERKRRELGG